MGMGLVLSKSIAEAHGGQLHALRNDPDRGMTFQLTIPVVGATS
jgi:signal transduction histidine kinase